MVTVYKVPEHLKGISNYSLVGKRFGMLVVLSTDNKSLLCKCDCGNERIVDTTRLKNGKIFCCGCTKRNIGKIVIFGMDVEISVVLFLQLLELMLIQEIYYLI